VSGLTVRVWRRYGQVRLYVSADGREIGWYDPRTGRFQLSEQAMAAEFWAAALAECDTLLRAGKLTERILPGSAREEPAPAGPAAGAPIPPGAAAGEPAPRGPAAGEPVAPGPARREPAPPEPALPGPVRPGPAAEPGASDHWVVRDPAWDDLATSAPGSAARSHSAELRRRHPVLTVLARAVGVRTTARSFAIGARGERTVGRSLNRWAAAAGWHVLHAVPVGHRGADIDHVVIGPFGMVTVNTKTTATSVWVGQFGMVVGRTKVDYLPKSRAEARRAAGLVSQAAGWPVPVQPAIVFVGARRFTVQRGGPDDVAVLPSARALHRWLRRQPAVLSPEQVAGLYAVARRPGTWQRSRQPPA
jgi:hypothetical protein